MRPFSREIQGKMGAFFFKRLQTESHIRRKANNVVLQSEILRMNDIAASNALVEFFLEPLKRSGRIVFRRFHLDRENLVFQPTIVRQKEINFNVVAVFCLVVMGVKVQQG